MKFELQARLRHICVGRAQPLATGASVVVRSAIVKRPVDGPVTVGRLGLAGDEQTDLSVHGGLDKAVYAYPVEHAAFWRAQRQAHGAPQPEMALSPGFMGENLAIEGLLERDVWVGDTLHFAGCVLRVTAPRQPCYKFNAVMGFAQAAKLMVREARCGFYLAVEQPGALQAGERFTLCAGPRALSITEAIHAKWAKYRN
ncbi:MAG: MOSC domain-containing protein [Desulfovibrionaceae bacterium]|nr:MOSC domain-containing protein [Desulfovibrionaceae bacterium]